MSNKRNQQHISAVFNNRVVWALLAGIGTVLAVVFFVFGSQSYNVPAGFEPRVEGAPSIAVISDPVINHGDVVVDRSITSSFQIQNIGDETLVVVTPWVEVHEGCCPPRAEIGRRQLRPGEITTVSMTYMMHPEMDGLHDLRIHVRSTDPNNPEVQLTALSNWVRG
jgi:hypothetical protein